MSRSLKKGPYVDPRLMRKVERMNNSGQKKIIKTWSRACQIPPEFVSHTFAVHNGMKHVPVFVTEQMVGHRLGEFAPTRKFKGHGGQLAKASRAGSSAETATAGAAPAAPVAGPSAPKK